MTDPERALLDSALSVLETRTHEGDREGRAALRVLARAALARPGGEEPFDFQVAILNRMWQGPQDVFDALVRDAMQWRHQRATPAPDASPE